MTKLPRPTGSNRYVRWTVALALIGFATVGGTLAVTEVHAVLGDQQSSRLAMHSEVPTGSRPAHDLVVADSGLPAGAAKEHFSVERQRAGGHAAVRGEGRAPKRQRAHVVVPPGEAPGLPASMSEQGEQSMSWDQRYRIQHVIGQGQDVVIPQGDPTCGFRLDPAEKQRVTFRVDANAQDSVLYLPTLEVGALQIDGKPAIPGQWYLISDGMVLEAQRPTAINIRPAQGKFLPLGGSG